MSTCPIWTPLREIALRALKAELGRDDVTEVRPNWSPRIMTYLARCTPPINVDAPWCAALMQFVTDVAAKSVGLRNPLDEVVHEAYCPSYAQWAAKKAAERIVAPADAAPGDLILFNFRGQRWDHVGMLEHTREDGYFATCEGNTNAAGSRDGDTIARKRRRIGACPQMIIRWDAGLGVLERIEPDRLAAA